MPIDFDLITSNSNKNNITKLFQGLSLKNSHSSEQHYETPVNSVHNHPSRPLVSGRFPRTNEQHYGTPLTSVPSHSSRPLVSGRFPRTNSGTFSKTEHIYEVPFYTKPRAANDEPRYARPQDNLGVILPQSSEYARPQDNLEGPYDTPQGSSLLRKLHPPSHPPSPFPPGEGKFNSKSRKWIRRPSLRTKKYSSRPQQDEEDHMYQLSPPKRPTKRQLPALPASKPKKAPAPAPTSASASKRKHRILPKPPTHHISDFFLEETTL